jgi:transglutaminase-like putative cysteine protease
VQFDTFFRVSSYATVACGVLALALTGGIGWAFALLLALLLAAAWKAEGTRWQLSERVSLLAVLASLPLFYVDWKLQTNAFAVEPAHASISALGHFIILLSLVKVFGAKQDRDWLFLYLISFFEVLLAAGLSLSPRFIVALALYTFAALTTVVCFEIRKAQRRVRVNETRYLRAAPPARLLRRLFGSANERPPRSPQQWGDARRFLLVSVCLLALIFALAAPIFFFIPRLSASALARAGNGGGGAMLIGFSDEVTIGEFGRLQQTEQVVMRVRVEDPYAARNLYLRWRGVALDEFDGHTWRRTPPPNAPEKTYLKPDEHNAFQFGTTPSIERLTTQSFFVEPNDTPILFAAARAVALQGALPYIGRDSEGALSTRPHTSERIAYRVYSDTTGTPLEALRSDRQPYTRPVAERYLQLPARVDPRIEKLTRSLIAETDNRYDAARVVEQYLRNDFRYSLDLEARGDDPLADFLFRVRAGHCEYFATSMAVMLRSVGIAARVVNGFQMGEYNDAADVYTVRQSDAHSWVEAYFPQTDSWVAFDPTPSAGRPGHAQQTGLRGAFGKYAEALEMFWIQWVVDYDRQDQQQLATTVRRNLWSFRHTGTRFVGSLTARLSAFWSRASTLLSAKGRPLAVAPALLLLLAVAVVLGCFFVARRRGFSLRRKLKEWRGAGARPSAVAFYERMTRALAARGLNRAPHQTPLEFAGALDVPEALLVTRSYNRVRFGAHELTRDEAARIETWLQRIEQDVNRQSSIVNRSRQ